ncbi:hypothetical protein JL722_6470 [Aureococcus anophagefferens]|nr:hypothetical protein JL722_6470 [Aureococcus anophagefferens]
MAREKAAEMQVNMRVNDALARLGREESDISKEFTQEINDLIEDLRGQKGLSRAAGAYVVHAIFGVACSNKGGALKAISDALLAGKQTLLEAFPFVSLLVESEPFKRDVIKNDASKKNQAALARLGLASAILDGRMLATAIENATVEAAHLSLCSHPTTIVMARGRFNITAVAPAYLKWQEMASPLGKPAARGLECLALGAQLVACLDLEPEDAMDPRAPHMRLRRNERGRGDDDGADAFVAAHFNRTHVLPLEVLSLLPGGPVAPVLAKQPKKLIHALIVAGTMDIVVDILKEIKGMVLIDGSWRIVATPDVPFAHKFAAAYKAYTVVVERGAGAVVPRIKVLEIGPGRPRAASRPSAHDRRLGRARARAVAPAGAVNELAKLPSEIDDLAARMKRCLAIKLPVGDESDAAESPAAAGGASAERTAFGRDVLTAILHADGDCFRVSDWMQKSRVKALKNRIVDGGPGGDIEVVVDGKSEKLLAAGSGALFREVVDAGLGMVIDVSTPSTNDTKRGKRAVPFFLKYGLPSTPDELAEVENALAELTGGVVTLSSFETAYCKERAASSVYPCDSIVFSPWRRMCKKRCCAKRGGGTEKRAADGPPPGERSPASPRMDPVVAAGASPTATPRTRARRTPSRRPWTRAGRTSSPRATAAPGAPAPAEAVVEAPAPAAAPKAATPKNTSPTGVVVAELRGAPAPAPAPPEPRRRSFGDSSWNSSAAAASTPRTPRRLPQGDGRDAGRRRADARLPAARSSRARSRAPPRVVRMPAPAPEIHLGGPGAQGPDAQVRASPRAKKKLR